MQCVEFGLLAVMSNHIRALYRPPVNPYVTAVTTMDSFSCVRAVQELCLCTQRQCAKGQCMDWYMLQCSLTPAPLTMHAPGKCSTMQTQCYQHRQCQCHYNTSSSHALTLPALYAARSLASLAKVSVKEYMGKGKNCLLTSLPAGFQT